MQERYAAFVRSYLRWYNRMSTDPDHPNYFPCGSFSALQTSNFFSLSLPLIAALPRWAFLAILALAWSLIYLYNRKFFNSISEPPKFSRLSDNVPGIREVRGIYAYLLFSVALFVVSVFLTGRGAA